MISRRSGVMGFMMLMCIVLSFIAVSNGGNLPITQPRQNVRETLAQAANLDSICLTHSRPGKPFSACMVGLPVYEWPVPGHSAVNISQDIKDPVKEWCAWTHLLPVASTEPQELEIFGSMTMELCMQFEASKVTKAKTVNLTPIHEFYKNASAWCKYTEKTAKGSVQVPVQLPRGLFLICGDRIWHGIPANATGGPCSIGEISMLSPDLNMLRERKRREKRSIEQYAADCNDKIFSWDKKASIATAIFSPQTASGVALTQVDRMGCWLSKHARSVSVALDDMLKDISGVRQATLQNRAAIDYLLLAHGHGCEEFEGMCCMNLSDHSRSIHESIKNIKDSINKLGEITGSWIDQLVEFFDISPIWRGILRVGFYVLIVLLVLILVVPCIFACLKRAMNRIAKEVFLVQTEGGDVGSQD
ncbi:syncytin-A-like isoform X1 [Ammospiza nelsoni]|uniref:syncytin-A-like isoform X1 n=1 Tax=Ammospiza nelsoni TaxID=2857394 RepID=UPI00286C704E|nr:syncytin-A-like isoform X1 [Ammospiza nelsoni]XP_059347658.1 syncytin-A-like isoform X1 [Ammospiza nelsoni]